LNSKTWSTELPEALRNLYDPEKYAKAQAYDRDRNRLGNLSSYLSLALMLGMLFLAGFAWLNDLALSSSDNAIIQALIFFGVLYAVSDILSLPFAWYGIFHIEEKYGFNKMTPKTFILDKVKSYLLTAILGGGMIALVLWFYYTAGPRFWIYAWIAVTAVSLFFSMFYTSLIVPLFNKLSPLEDGALRSQIESFAQKVNFPLKNIFTIDGSKRSTKANAYFSGIGPQKSIVLYDTLMKDQTEEELVAILAHEVGHYKKKHVLQGMTISILQTGFLLFLVGIFVGNAQLSAALSVERPNFHIGILAFGILYSPISMVTGLFMNRFSRKNEYEADNYARENYSAPPLISALKKLSVNHLSNLNPHPAYVFFNYSHPPLLARIRNLERGS
jgi:STE24 endopeptidase